MSFIPVLNIIMSEDDTFGSCNLSSSNTHESHTETSDFTADSSPNNSDDFSQSSNGEEASSLSQSPNESETTETFELSLSDDNDHEKPVAWSCCKGVGIASDQNYRWRREMEDELITIDKFLGKNNGFFAVYDGHGGRQTVEYVSQHLHKLFAENLKDRSTVIDAWKSSHQKCHNDVKEAGIGETNGTTTLTCYLHTQPDGTRILGMANAGDSRAVLCSQSDEYGMKVRRLTVDHKPTTESEKKRITALGGYILNQRINGMIAVSRSIGDHIHHPFVSCEPFTHNVKLSSDDSFVVLACDGVWDVLSDREACNVVIKVFEEGYSVQDAANALLRMALKKGSKDNISIIVIEF